MFKFSQTAWTVMYTTNAIESPNSGRTVFPNVIVLTKALYLATWEMTKKMDHARSGLGPGLRGTQHYVPRQAEQNLTGKRPGNGPEQKVSVRSTHH